MLNRKIAILGAPFLALLLSGCLATRSYERPDHLVPEELYGRALDEDSSSLADLSWREFFPEPELQILLDTALQRNFDLGIALEQLTAAHALYRQGRAAYWPSLDITAQQTHQELAQNSQFGRFFDRLDQYELSGALSWEADIWGRITSQKRAARARWEQSRAARHAIHSQVVAQVASGYYLLLILDEQAGITRQTLATRQETLETLQALKEAGQVTAVAVEQARGQYHRTQAALLEQQREIALAENSLRSLLGKAPGAVQRGELPTRGLPQEWKTGIPAVLLQNRPDVRSAEQGLIEAFALRDAARANFYPRLQITAATGFQSLDFNQLITPQSVFLNIVTNLTQPVFNQRSIRSQYEAASAEERAAVLRFRQSLVTAGREVADALTRLETADSLTRIREAEYRAYEKAARDSEALLEQGLANYLEVLTARENALNSRLTALAARNEWLQAYTELYRALGGGSE